jgi:rRNA-processing protein FCF1
MTDKIHIRSISFDTSFLLKEKSEIDQCIKRISKDNIPCFLTSTVVSELEQLKIWGRISLQQYNKAISRWKKTHGQIIDFKNRLLSDAFAKECMISMEKYHGVKEENIANDCSILISTLKHGMDVILSEDFHFTSKITQQVISEVTNTACTEFHQMCNSQLYALDAQTFLKTYNQGKIDVKQVETSMKHIKKHKK